MSALLTLSTTANERGTALQTITTVPAVVSVLPAAGVAALPSPPRKTRKTSHQEQIARQNERKHKTVHAQAHARATTLVVEERTKEKENCRTTAEVVIVQVEGEFRARGFPVTMSKPTINRYVVLNMISTFPLAGGYDGAMPHAAFELLVIAAESFIKIKGVNKDRIECNTLMIMFNELCSWLVMSASFRGFPPPKTIDTLTCRRDMSAPTQTMSATSSRVGSSDALSMSCRHVCTCRQKTTQIVLRYYATIK